MTDGEGKPMTGGQVLGGRWRPLQYFFQQSVYADVMATCGKGGLCYLKNDASAAATYRVVVTEEPLQSTRGPSGAHSQFTTTIEMPPGPGAVQYFHLPETFDMGPDHVYFVETSASDEQQQQEPEPLSEHISLHMAPKDLHTAKGVNVTLSVSAGIATVSNAGAVGAALYVTLTTQAQGRFAENCFLLRAGEARRVAFVPAGGAASMLGHEQQRLLESTTRVEHLGMYL